jgi:Ca2+-binding RTX toxin-like protein
MSDSQNAGSAFGLGNYGGNASIFGTNQLLDVLGLVQSKLQQAASSPDLFVQVLGDKANTAEVQALRSRWSVGDFSQLPSIQILSAANMNGAYGAYANSTQNIYLSDALFQSNASPVDSVLGAAGVLTEEAFHWLDDRVGKDTQGDEGELAKNLLFGVKPSDSELVRIKAESDRGFITVGGQSVAVEQALIHGNNSNNTLNGTNSDDVISGYNGNDIVYANGGNDLVYGGGNDDKLWGEDGADELRGDDGNDELRGGNQDDRLWGGNQDDKLWGEEGNDQLVGDAGNDELSGGNGDDRIWGSSGDDRLWGESGSDQLTGDDGNDFLNGYGFGDNERDTLIGGTGADRFILGDANSIFYARNGNSDAAVIADFNRGEGDVISLKKLAFNNTSGDRAYGYRLVTVGVNTEIRVDNTNELMATLQNRTGVSLLQGFSFEGTPKTVANDFDGDGTADVLWRSSAGDTVIWNMKNGTKQSHTILENVSEIGGWKVAGIGDFNGDGASDVLWHSNAGDTVIWNMKNGTKQSHTILENVSEIGGWKVAGIGDFNGDGTSDVLWRSNAGDTVIWNMKNGTKQSHTILENVSEIGGWKVAGTGDFNGDGTADVLWRSSAGNTVIWNIKNGTKQSHTILENVSEIGGWKVAGTGDFNGDGTADVLWRSSAGNTVIWNMKNGAKQSHAILENVSEIGGWKVAGTGDFNGDGTSDVLWRSSAGDTVIWNMKNGTKQSHTILEKVSESAGWKVAGSISAAPLSYGLPTSASSADSFFKLQYKDPKYNPDGPSSSLNCAPTSLAIILKTLGLEPPGLTVQQSIIRASSLMGQSNPGWSNWGQIEAGIRNAGGIPENVGSWADLDRSLAAGKPVSCNGWYGQSWRNQFPSPSLTGAGTTLHQIAVIGRTNNGLYVVADPMYKGGVVEMTQAQLSVFFQGSSGYNGNPVGRAFARK